MSTKKFTRTLILLVIAFPCLNTSAQIVSGNAFLKGNYIEIGIAPCGTYGSSVVAPAGYHPRGGTAGPDSLGMVADPFKDGWTTGSPAYMGDYFLPKLPEEGFGVEINATNYNNNSLCGTSGIAGSMTARDARRIEQEIRRQRRVDPDLWK